MGAVVASGLVVTAVEFVTDDEWPAQLTGADRRGLTPLFWQHVPPYGEVRLDMSSGLGLTCTPEGPPVDG